MSIYLDLHDKYVVSNIVAKNYYLLETFFFHSFKINFKPKMFYNKIHLK